MSRFVLKRGRKTKPRKIPFQPLLYLRNLTDFIGFTYFKAGIESGDLSKAYESRKQKIFHFYNYSRRFITIEVQVIFSYLSDTTFRKKYFSTLLVFNLNTF